ncbi:hypothetical protein PGTUg99_029518 [Puccinia graminis f. sp. tritici]|uniref:DDE Tnp4 domain-containing protein n=1 Tax=Puccinia graminis f. sp. tritici TaxID=56615 RepID=A0A5B0RUP5_PUCGR|nr:hypothetical protein PGTUg99_029518 [Puccinia graminis f. sp. tritici]
MSVKQARYENGAELEALMATLTSALFGPEDSPVGSEDNSPVTSEDDVAVFHSTECDNRCAWARLYEARDDRAYIRTMGVDVRTFEELFIPFSTRWYEEPIPWADHAVPEGEAQMDPDDPAGSLGLVLHWLCSTMHDSTLERLFAISPRAYAQSLRRGINSLLAVLKHHPSARIRWPTREEIFHEYSMSIKQKYPEPKKAFGFSVGFNLPIGIPGEYDVEETYYNERADRYYYRNIFTFAPDGTILDVVLMIPGGRDDGSRSVEGFYEKLLEKTPAGYRLISDSGFPSQSKRLRSQILAPIQQRSQLPEPPRTLSRIKTFNEQVVLTRQVTDWTKHIILDSFERLREPMSLDSAKEQLEALQMASRLHQFRWRLAQTERAKATYQSVWDENQLPELNLDQKALYEIQPPCHVCLYYREQYRLTY